MNDNNQDVSDHHQQQHSCYATDNLLLRQQLNNDSDLVLSNVKTDSELRQFDTIKWSDAYRQILACFLALSVVIHAGINMSYSAILLPQLDEPKSDLKVTQSQASWLASIVAVMLPLGAAIVGPMMDKYGRRLVLILTAVYFCVAWLMHALSRHFWHLLVARILAGIGGGLTTAAMIYTSEVTHPEYRTMMLSLNSVSVAFGILLTCVLGMWLKWRTMAFFNSAMSILTVGLLYVIPESPHWLVHFKDDPEQADRALKWLYVNDDIRQNQYQQLTKIMRKKNTDVDQNDKQSTLVKLLRSCKRPEVYKPLIILLVLFVIQQASCAYVIIFYAVDMFREIGGQFDGAIDEYVALILLGVIRFLMSIVAAITSKNVGRRPLFYLSGIGMSLTSLTAAIYTNLTLLIPLATETPGASNVNNNMSYNSDVVLFCCLGYVMFSSLGYLVIPWTLIGELLPVKVRAILGSAMISFAYILMAITVKIFPFVLDAVKIHVIFYLMSVISLTGVCFVFFFLPETLGKSFDDIERYFKRK